MSASSLNADESSDRPAGASEDVARAFSRPVAERDEASLALVALRDVALASVLLSIFGAAEAWAQVSGLAFASLIATLDGFLVGAATCALAHEWGHFAGARLGGGHAPLKPISGFLPLYDFDYANNDRRAFDWMGIGGNIAHISVPLLYLFAVGASGPGTAALVAGATGFAVFSSVIEWPVIRRSRAGMGALEALGTIPRDFVSRTLPWALGSALLIFLVL
jgi:hypothetical protein